MSIAPRSVLLAALVAIAGCAPQDASDAPDALAAGHAAEIDDVVAAFHEAGQFNGSVLVAENGNHLLCLSGDGELQWDVGLGKCERLNPEGVVSSTPVVADLLGDGIAELAVGCFAGAVVVMDADGSNKRQLTDNGRANFGPYFFPDGERIIFSSNMDAESVRVPDFDLYAINVDGTGLERLTYAGDFDGFPMFNSDGTKLIFASNRGNELPRETNLFMVDWVN